MKKAKADPDGIPVCAECAFFGRPDSKSSLHFCTCWHVKGPEGGYKHVNQDSPACARFIGKAGLCCVGDV